LGEGARKSVELQCVAVCCSVLQCVAACCSVLQRVAVCCSVLQMCLHVLLEHAGLRSCEFARKNLHLFFISFYLHSTLGPFGLLQYVAACCSVLQCVAVCCSALQCVAVCCSVLQCVAVC